MTAAYIIAGFCMAFAFLKAYFAAKGQHYKEIASKSVASALFIVVGILACAHGGGGKPYGWLMLGGGVLGMMGDLFLSFDDIADGKQSKDFVSYMGVIAFFLGHVSYICAFALLDAHTPWIISFAALMPIAYILVGKKFTRIFDNKTRGIFMTVYFLALGANIALAVSHAVAVGGGVMSALIISGSVLFALSDSLLGISSFSKGDFLPRSVSGFAVILTYYPAQLLLMLSIFFAI